MAAFHLIQNDRITYVGRVDYDIMLLQLLALLLIFLPFLLIPPPPSCSLKYHLSRIVKEYQIQGYMVPQGRGGSTDIFTEYFLKTVIFLQVANETLRG